jgi:hypothetical protein
MSGLGWQTIRAKDRDTGIITVHIIPENDKMPHDESAFCLCEPRIEPEDEHSAAMVIHNSYDRREEFEARERMMPNRYKGVC